MIIVTTKTIMIPITLRSKEAKVVPADQKILIDAINKFQVMKKNKPFLCVALSIAINVQTWPRPRSNLEIFQAGLEKVDSHDHIVTPPLYGQVCHDLYKNKKTIITIGNLQVVRFAVYVYFTLSLIASQEVSKDPYTFVPIFLILKVDLI